MSGYNSDGDAENTNTSSLADLIDQLSEKRATTREKALQDMIKTLRMDYHYDDVEKIKFTLVEDLKKELKKGNHTEQELACQLASVTAITQGDEAEQLYKDISSSLKDLISNSGSQVVKASALTTLAMLIFISESDEQATINSLDIFSSAFSSQESSTEQILAGLKGWSLLSSTISAHYTFATQIPAHLLTLANLLRSDQPDVRIAAGEVIAFLYECAVVEAAMDEESEEIGPNPDEFAEYAGMEFDDLMDLMKSLTKDKTKGRAKKDKEKQRTPFKDIVSYIETGSVPEEVLSFRHQKVSFSSWAQLAQLNAFRDALGQGLQAHFESNQFLQEVFDTKIAKDVKKVTMTAVEKRMYMGDNTERAKNRTRTLGKSRNTRSKEVDYVNQDDD
eukprot:TRINITY_DN492_c0_g1_i1.p1 TRINITY_DN492_c0_g1~~TRINITY_DN492_c0_g1_i1.p1  ORF type:complete len:391 (+),score=115.63 TRINITY_DN492_c0_g1_i1:265-1437(+)